MALDWITAMDACASAGIINYDAPAAILGQKPRYWGHPDFNKVITMSGPGHDVFDPNNQDIVKPQSWKKKAFGWIAAGLGVLATIKLIQAGKLNITTLKNIGSKAWDIIKTPFKWIGKLFKPATATAAGTTPPATP